jgi:hypothetical protein
MVAVPGSARNEGQGILLDLFKGPRGYVPVEVAGERNLQAALGLIAVHPVIRHMRKDHPGEVLVKSSLVVRSRRGLERPQTLRPAVAWSYDLLEDAERSLSPGFQSSLMAFDLQSVCAVAGLDDIDEDAVLDLLDALVRSL